nr:hypothetical protein GCM10020063_000770 [Dactylosporangium thailandense]
MAHRAAAQVRAGRPPGVVCHRAGVDLLREQVYRLVTQPPQRLSMDTLAALCDILECTPNDLIEVEATNTSVAKRAAAAGVPPPVQRTQIRRPRGA